VSVCLLVVSSHCSLNVLTASELISRVGGHLEKSGNLTLVREKSGKLGKVGNCGLPAMCYRSCDSHKINITRVLLSRVDMPKMGLPILIHYSLGSTCRPICIPLMPLQEMPGKVREFDEDGRVVTLNKLLLHLSLLAVCLINVYII